MAKSVHSGHRDRVRDEFLFKGISESTPPHKVVEYILFHSIPQKDTNETAHALFGTLRIDIRHTRRTCGASFMQVKGISKVSVSLLKLILPVARIYSSEKNSADKVLKDIDDISQYLLGKYFGYDKEVFSMLSLNASGKVLGYDVLSSGNVSEVTVSVRDIVEVVLKRRAVCVAIAHNHPGGVALPSEEDIKITELIDRTLKNINAKLLDHVIIAGDDYVSMAQSRCFDYIFMK